jgi:hypothetical protein
VSRHITGLGCCQSNPIYQRPGHLPGPLLLLTFSWLPCRVTDEDGFLRKLWPIDGSPAGLPFGAFSSEVEPVRVEKTRQFENLEPRFDSIESEKALDCARIAEIERFQARTEVLRSGKQ